jgi:pectate lyase
MEDMMRRYGYVAGGVLLAMAACGETPSDSSPGASSEAVGVATVLPAFPGAEGYGTQTVHGRGGRVIHVTNLNDTGPGSLREALTATGPRIVVFRVGGLITLATPIDIRSPNVYVAGQTAPGGGIAVRGSQIAVKASDVVIRHVRSRPGDGTTGTACGSRDGFQIINGPWKNIVLDHVSASWGIDENMSIWPSASSTPTTDITIQWSMITEGLLNSCHPEGPHGMGVLLGDFSSRISFHHNLMAHNNQRNPRIKGSVSNADIVNNVFYNYGHIAGQFGESNKLSTANFVKNYWKRGPSSTASYELSVATKMSGGTGIHYLGNAGPRRPTGTEPEYAISNQGPLYAVTTRYPAPAITEQAALDAYPLILAKAGASKPVRDAVDTRVVNEVQNGTGRIIDSPSQVGGYPTYAAGTPPVDTDLDGMPDAWESARGLNPASAADATTDRDGDGYTNIEEYVNSLAI